MYFVPWNVYSLVAPLLLSIQKVIILWSEKLSCLLHCHSFIMVTILLSAIVKSTLLVPLLDSKVVSWQSSLMMCILLPMTNSSTSLPLLLVNTSCHIYDHALLSIVVNRPLPLAYCNIFSNL